MQSETRIVLLHGAPAFGAVEQYVLALAEALAKSGQRVSLVYPDAPALAPFGSICGVDAEPLSYPLPDALRLTLDLVRVLLRLRPSVVHVTDVWPPALVAARLAGVRRLLVTHHTPELPRRDNAAGRLWWTLGWAARPEVVYTSETDRQRGGRRLRTHIVPLGIDLARYGAAAASRSSQSGAPPLVGNVARLAAQKGHDVLIEAARLVHGKRPEVRFAIAGEGELRSELGSRIRDAGLDGCFELLGHRDDVPELLTTFDVFAFPSRFEGLCLAVIEAQAAGVPVVATPVGGIRETVLPGETGLLVPLDDAPALADAILELLVDPARASALANRARAAVNERFSAERMVRETLALYGIESSR